MHPYEVQFERTRRYYNRFADLDGGRMLGRSSEEYVDDVHAFFLNCYHLKDYLIQDPAYTAHSSSQIEAFITNTPALAICADICNGLKHLKLNKPPRTGDMPKFGRKIVAVGAGHRLGLDGENDEDEPTTIAICVEVEHQGQKLDAFQIATDAMKAWERFVN